MTSLTNIAPQIIYGDILTCTNNGQGLSNFQTILQDGLGNNSPILIATNSINFNRGQGQFQLDGVSITANSIDINNICQPNPICTGIGSIKVPTGTTAQRPGIPVLGDVRFNTTINDLEYYIGIDGWKPAQSLELFNLVVNSTLTFNSKNIINGAGILTLLLPIVANVGDIIKIVGNLNGWIIAQNGGQTIHFVAQNTTTGAAGSLSSSAARDCVELMCVVNDTDYVVSSHEGILNVI